MKRAPLQRSSSLLPGRPPKRRKPAGTIEGELWRAGLGPCAMRHLSACDGRIDGHHVITRQQLRRHGHTDRLLDHANRLALCRHHHQEHHSRRRPVPLELVPAVAVEFAVGLGLGWVIDRYYPASEEAAA